MNILIAGATGLIGKQLTSILLNAGHQIHVLTRNESRARSLLPGAARILAWASADQIAAHLNEIPVDGAINLAGESIGNSKWTDEQKLAIVRSRIETTKTLVKALSQCATLPKFFISASAIGYYGETNDRICDESSPNGDGFLAETCQLWEETALAIDQTEVRTCIVRLAPVVSAEGGFIQKMLPLFRAGLGGPLGSRDQWMSWISVEDAANIFKYLAEASDQRGFFNAVAPQMCTNSEFAAALAKALGKAAPVRVPSWALKLALGEMAESILMNQRIQTLRLTDFPFQFGTLESALKHVVAPATTSEQGAL
jgi:uncharacterized protein